MIKQRNAARILAKLSHAGQVDKAGEDYFSGHLTRVARGFAGVNAALETAAYLHDIVEDTPVTLSDLREMGFPDHIVMAVDKLSRRRYEGDAKETYSSYLERIIRPESSIVGLVSRRIAMTVKASDLVDHLRDPSHISIELEEKYRWALYVLTVD